MLARLRNCENARATGSASSTGICSSSRVSVAKSASLPPRAFCETIEQVATRVDRVIAAARDADGPVALFAHGHVLRVLAARWCELDPIEGRLAFLSPKRFAQQLPKQAHVVSQGFGQLVAHVAVSLTVGSRQ